LILCFGDVTNISKLEHSKAENNLKNTLLKSVSHELKTPMSSIIHFAENLNELVD
jgi:K+-sensing histidine kinase KdpD